MSLQAILTALLRRSQQREEKVTRLRASGKVPSSEFRPKGAAVRRVRIHFRSLARRLEVEKALSKAKKEKFRRVQEPRRK